MNDASLWQAVMTRDERRAGTFVYAVRSTGIYCRATCPSRRPSRHQVRFFDTPQTAEAAGFRACLRCRPKDADGWVATVRQAIDEQGDAPLQLRALAVRLGMSASALQRRFREQVGVTPRQYADALRLRRLKKELRRAPRVADAVYEAGFGSGSRVYENAGARLGMTPAAYRRGGAGALITFTTVRCPLGHMLVAATTRGLATVSLGDDVAALERALHEEYPAAELRRDDRRLRRWTRDLLGQLGGGPTVTELPMDVQATAFEWKVWEALRRIPRGETRTYAEVAREMGRAGAARAVGRACGRNRLALLIPCHRVVPAAGGTGGYRWGAARKRALLELEVRSNLKGARRVAGASPRGRATGGSPGSAERS